MPSNSAASLFESSQKLFANGTENMTVFLNEEITESFRREKSAQFFTILAPSFVYTAVLMMIGMPGNLIVVLVYLLKMAKTTSRHFIISLAICDFFNCAFGMPVELSLLLNFYNFDYPILCKMSRFTTFIMNNASTCVLICIAVDRFRRVCLPLRPNMTVRHSKILCSTFAVVSILSAIPSLFIYNTISIPVRRLVNNVSVRVNLKTCYVDPGAGTTLPLAFSLYLFVFIIGMIMALSTMYGLIGRIICAQRTQSRPRRGTLRSSISFDALTHRVDTNTNKTSIRLLRSLSHHSPNLFRSRGKSTSRSNSPIPDIAEPLAIPHHAHSDTCVRRHGGKEVRAGRTTLILFIVTLVFILSFVPYLILAAMRYITPAMFKNLASLELTVYHLTLRSYLLNSAANPLIYCFLNRQFRQKVQIFFKDTFCCKKK
ncbi:orexin receptor type 2-like [Mya arenaria]|uniref:orexin receptor type 2-like n=1 Tax=Mya arenaria TaxID=6604 RepID=UPI0022E84061|nr:orexin receptor type 2-like [Mya arenaria]